MEYTKPEVALLGDAALLIQGSKNGVADPDGGEIGLLDCEMED